MEGRQADALKAADEVRAKMHGDMLRDPAMGGMVQHMNLTPLYTKVRFGMWDRRARRAGAAGRPAVHVGDVAYGARAGARRAGHASRRPRPSAPPSPALKDDPALKTLDVSSVNVASAIVAIAHEVLAGEIETRSGAAPTQAARHFAQAVALEDDLTYMEPPDWPIPVRQLQGAALLRARTREGGRGRVSRRHEEVSRQRLVAVRPAGQPREAGTRGRCRGGESAARRSNGGMADIQVAAGRPRDPQKALPRPTTH